MDSILYSNAIFPIDSVKTSQISLFLLGRRASRPRQLPLHGLRRVTRLQPAVVDLQVGHGALAPEVAPPGQGHVGDGVGELEVGAAHGDDVAGLGTVGEEHNLALNFILISGIQRLVGA